MTIPTPYNGAPNGGSGGAEGLHTSATNGHGGKFKNLGPEVDLKALDEQALSKTSRDFRSDTLTVPTQAMFALMAEASRGDDVYGEDETTNAFQARVAELTGKEAGLFCVSGTMTNQLAIRTHLHQPPHSVLCDSRSHVHNYEAGGIAFHSQATTHPILPQNKHHLTFESDIFPNLILSNDIHMSPTRLVCLENTLSGMCFPQEEIENISREVRGRGVGLHLDGARIWEVAVKTGLSLKELCDPFDTVSLCMSKGLGAPIGSVLVGKKEFIEKAKWFRKMFGGGIRQAGILSSAADYALTYNFPQLKRTHQLAKELASKLKQVGVKLILPVETNMVFIETEHLGFGVFELSDRAREPSSSSPNRQPIQLRGTRLIVHIQVTREAIDDLIKLVEELKAERADVAKTKEENDWDEGEQNAFANGEWEGFLEGKKPAVVKRPGVAYTR